MGKRWDILFSTWNVKILQQVAYFKRGFTYILEILAFQYLQFADEYSVLYKSPQHL